MSAWRIIPRGRVWWSAACDAWGCISQLQSDSCSTNHGSLSRMSAQGAGALLRPPRASPAPLSAQQCPVQAKCPCTQAVRSYWSLALLAHVCDFAHLFCMFRQKQVWPEAPSTLWIWRQIKYLGKLFKLLFLYWGQNQINLNPVLLSNTSSPRRQISLKGSLSLYPCRHAKSWSFFWAYVEEILSYQGSWGQTSGIIELRVFIYFLCFT